MPEQKQGGSDEHVGQSGVAGENAGAVALLRKRLAAFRRRWSASRKSHYGCIGCESAWDVPDGPEHAPACPRHFEIHGYAEIVFGGCALHNHQEGPHMHESAILEELAAVTREFITQAEYTVTESTEEALLAALDAADERLSQGRSAGWLSTRQGHLDNIRGCCATTPTV